MVRTPDTVVTGDAVVLDVQIAQLPVRALGALIDLVVMVVGYLIGLLLWGAASARYDEALTGAIMVIFTVAVVVGYPVAMETATRGRSLGKFAMGLRVVSDDGSPERFRQALFRALSGVVEIWMLFGGPAVIASLSSAQGKRLGDVFAGTVVISQRGPKAVGTPSMPPSLQWWGSTLELSGLGPQETEMARQFLARASELTPHVRDEMANRIGAEVTSRISPPPPPGTPPQLSLAAVLAERHRRELSRLMPAQAPPLRYPAGPPAPPSPPASPSAPAPHRADGGFVPPD